MVPAPFRVVLDANVLFPFTVRDTLLRAAALGMYQVHWSEEILAEATRNLIATGRMNDEQAAHLLAAMRNAFPEALVQGHQALVPSMPNDEKDRHVAAVAIKAGAQVIVTSNLRDKRPPVTLDHLLAGLGKTVPRFETAVRALITADDLNR